MKATRTSKGGASRTAAKHSETRSLFQPSAGSPPTSTASGASRSKRSRNDDEDADDELTVDQKLSVAEPQLLLQAIAKTQCEWSHNYAEAKAAKQCTMRWEAGAGHFEWDVDYWQPLLLGDVRAAWDSLLGEKQLDGGSNRYPFPWRNGFVMKLWTAMRKDGLKVETMRRFGYEPSISLIRKYNRTVARSNERRKDKATKKALAEAQSGLTTAS